MPYTICIFLGLKVYGFVGEGVRGKPPQPNVKAPEPPTAKNPNT